jgi:hypothetical protein
MLRIGLGCGLFHTPFVRRIPEMLRWRRDGYVPPYRKWTQKLNSLQVCLSAVRWWKPHRLLAGTTARTRQRRAHWNRWSVPPCGCQNTKPTRCVRDASGSDETITLIIQSMTSAKRSFAIRPLLSSSAHERQVPCQVLSAIVGMS